MTSPELQHRKPGRAPGHLDVGVDNRVDRIPPVRERGAGEKFPDPADEGFPVALGDRAQDRLLVREELVERPHGHGRVLGDQRGGGRVVANLGHEGRRRVEHPGDPFRASGLARGAAPRSGGLAHHRRPRWLGHGLPATSGVKG